MSRFCWIRKQASFAFSQNNFLYQNVRNNVQGPIDLEKVLAY